MKNTQHLLGVFHFQPICFSPIRLWLICSIVLGTEACHALWAIQAGGAWRIERSAKRDYASSPEWFVSARRQWRKQRGDERPGALRANHSAFAGWFLFLSSEFYARFILQYTYGKYGIIHPVY